MKKLSLLLALLFTVGCSSKEEPIHVNSIATKPIYIKELTTGMNYEISKLPKLITSDANEEVSIFSFDYFGKERILHITRDRKNVIYKYEMIVENDISLQWAIEEKVSESEGKKIQFDCRHSYYDTEIGTFNKSICTIVSGTQKLTLTESYPRDKTDSPLHLTNLILVDETLAKQAVKEKYEEYNKQYQLDQAKAKKDI